MQACVFAHTSALWRRRARYSEGDWDPTTDCCSWAFFVARVVVLGAAAGVADRATADDAPLGGTAAAGSGGTVGICEEEEEGGVWGNVGGRVRRVVSEGGRFGFSFVVWWFRMTCHCSSCSVDVKWTHTSTHLERHQTGLGLVTVTSSTPLIHAQV